MIRKFGVQHHEAFINYINENAVYSIFLYADAIHYGYDGEVFKAWGGFDETGRLAYVFAKYYETLILYSNSDRIDAQEICRYLDKNDISFKVFVGRSLLFEQMQKRIQFSKAEFTYLCELKKEDFLPVHTGIKTSIATEEDAQGIYDLRETIEEFAGMNLNLESLKTSVALGKTFIAKDQGKIIASAMCGAVTDHYANIGGVCTDIAWRTKGYASQLVSDLCGLLISQGYICSLSFNNPAAGSIYKRMGFKETGYIYLAVK